MAVRTAYVPVAGTAITAANHAKFPGGWIGYVEATSNQTGLSAATDLTNLSVTVTAGTSRRLLAEGYVKTQQQTSSATPSVTMLLDGVTIATTQVTLAAGGIGMHHPRSVQAPSSGSHTIKLQAGVGAGTVDVLASSSNVASLLVEDIGPSS